MAFRTGKVIIAKNIKLDKEYKDILTYNETQMLALVQTNQVASTTNCSFLDINKNVIDTNFTYANALKCNYMAIENPTYSNKWFFAFIDKVQYINNNTTRIYYTIDVWSTWRDYITFSDAFVIREHVSDDTIGLHTVPEDVEMGEPVQVEAPSKLFSAGNQCYICVGTTEFPDGMPQVDNARIYNGIYSGLYYLVFNSATYVSNFLYIMDKSAKSEAIVSIFLLPQSYPIGSTWYHGYPQDPSLSGYDYEYGLITNTNSSTILVNEVYFTPVNKLAGNFEPKNNKLLTYPYRYMYLTNNVGSDVIFKYEDFTSNLPKFTIVGSISPGCSIKCVPLNYKNVADSGGSMNSYNFGIVGGKYPVCSWKSDTYTNWLTQNGVNIGLNLLASGVSIVAGVASGNAAGVAGGVIGIGNTIGQVYQHSLIPDQAKGNTNSSDISYSSGMLDFVAYKMSIRPEYAKIIDDYFTIRGYKVNSLKVPNFNTRPIFNYVQISSESTIGYSNSNTYNVNASDMDIINNIFRQGTTLWHNHANIGNYSLDNRIVS